MTALAKLKAAVKKADTEWERSYAKWDKAKVKYVKAQKALAAYKEGER